MLHHPRIFVTISAVGLVISVFSCVSNNVKRMIFTVQNLATRTKCWFSLNFCRRRLSNSALDSSCTQVSSGGCLFGCSVPKCIVAFLTDFRESFIPGPAGDDSGAFLKIPSQEI